MAFCRLVSDFIVQLYSGLNLNQDKATKPQTVQIVRQGEATPYWFKFIHYNNGVFPCAMSACGQTAAFFPLPVQSCGRTACVWMPKFCVLPLSEAVRQLGASFPHRIGLPMRPTAVSDGLIHMPFGCKAFISLSFFYGASRLSAAITATICAVSCYNPPALPIRPSEAHFQTASTKEKTNHEPIPFARYSQPAARPAPAG